MTLPVNLDSLIHARTVESARLEFKAGWNPEAVLHTLCAFANDFQNLGGGYIFIGIAENDGTPVLPPQGLDLGQMDFIQKEILNPGYHSMSPNYHPIVEPVVFEGKHVLALRAPGGQTRPYKARAELGKDAMEWAYYIRKGSSTVRARNADENELLSLAASVPFDDRMNQHAVVADLSPQLIYQYLQEVGSELADHAADLPLAMLGRQMGIVGGPMESPLPINVGLMMFNAEPQRFFPAMQIDVVWFPAEGAGGDRFSEKIFQGPLIKIVPEVLNFIQRNFVTETVLKHAVKAESSRIANYPFVAIEEAIVNAVYHRGYDTREPVEIRISHDEFVVLSYPGPDRSVHLDQLKSGHALPRRYRNRRIGDFLKELKLTEGRATGIPKILRAMRENGSPPPIFDFDEDHSYFMVRLPVHPVITGGGADSEGVGPSQHNDRSTTQSTTQSTTRSDGPVDSLLRLLAEGNRSAGELRDSLGLTHRANFRRNYIQPALAQGFIEMTLPEKPGSRLQKYRLTKSGLKRVQQQSASP